jgi:hypothetical protein
MISGRFKVYYEVRGKEPSMVYEQDSQETVDAVDAQISKLFEGAAAEAGVRIVRAGDHNTHLPPGWARYAGPYDEASENVAPLDVDNDVRSLTRSMMQDIAGWLQGLRGAVLTYAAPPRVLQSTHSDRAPGLIWLMYAKVEGAWAAQAVPPSTPLVTK